LNYKLIINGIEISSLCLSMWYHKFVTDVNEVSSTALIKIDMLIKVFIMQTYILVCDVVREKKKTSAVLCECATVRDDGMQSNS